MARMPGIIEVQVEFVNIGPECFSDTDEKVISWKGQNYYRACDEIVCDLPEGGQAFCVKRVGHPGTIHEAYHGEIRDSATTPAPLAQEG